MENTAILFVTETTRHPSGELITDQSKHRTPTGEWIGRKSKSAQADESPADKENFEQKKEK